MPIPRTELRELGWQTLAERRKGMEALLTLLHALAFASCPFGLSFCCSGFFIIKGET